MRRVSHPTLHSLKTDQITDRYRDRLLRRADAVRLGILLLFVVLIGRLYALQMLAHDRYLQRALNNVIHRVTADPVRGQIFDRNGNLLVTNEPYYRLVLDRSWGGYGRDGISQHQARDSIRQVARLLNKASDWENNRLQLVHDMYRGFVPEEFRSSAGYVILEPRLAFDEVIKLEERRGELPGIRLEEGEIRQYNQGRWACHLLGYTGPISAEAYARLKSDGYRMTDWIGRDGLERVHDQVLRGTRGYTVQRRYANNLVEEEVLEENVPPTPGDDLYLSLDLRLQSAAEQLLEGQRGAIVMMRVDNGHLLAMASSPGYDLNTFRGGVRREHYRALLEDPNKPFLDRATGKGAGGYPPGSVFKIVSSLAALEEGLITPQTTFHCGGSIPVGNSRKRCHLRSGHGRLDFYGALKKSCDVYFYHVGDLLGPQRLADYACKLGFGVPTGLPAELHENPGLFPDPAWKLRYSRWGRWGRGDTLNTVIGQGFILATPLQVAVMTAAVANGGDVLIPQLVSHRRDAEGRLVWQSQREVKHAGVVSQKSLKIVQEAMRQVVHERGGTGRRAALEGITVAGKTGTAEHRNRNSDAWFCCYAPFENPEIAVAVVIESGGHGGAVAAPLAQQMLAAYFQPRSDTGVDQLVWQTAPDVIGALEN